MGEILRETPKNEGGRPVETPNDGSRGLSEPTLADMGISYNQSSQAQAIASIPEEVFEGGYEE